MGAIDDLHGTMLTCRLCEAAGLIPFAAPVVARQFGLRIMLLGQAPGITEVEARRPFHGRAGRELFRWMSSIGVGEDEFRSNVYMTSITKCFPGRTSGGSGDRRPSTREIALCRPWLEAQLSLVQPSTILLVGQLAIERYFQKMPLRELVGRRFDRNDLTLIPLPHPSGASRWLNAPENKALLLPALHHVRDEWQRLVGSDSGQQAPAVEG